MEHRPGRGIAVLTRDPSPTNAYEDAEEAREELENRIARAWLEARMDTGFSASDEVTALVRRYFARGFEAGSANPGQEE
jgi:hypothetical protein